MNVQLGQIHSCSIDARLNSAIYIYCPSNSICPLRLFDLNSSTMNYIVPRRGFFIVTSFRRDLECLVSLIRRQYPCLRLIAPILDQTLTMQHIFINPTAEQPPTHDLPREATLPDQLPPCKGTKHHPTDGGNENASLYFVGNATVIMFVELIQTKKWMLIRAENGLVFES